MRKTALFWLAVLAGCETAGPPKPVNEPETAPPLAAQPLHRITPERPAPQALETAVPSQPLGRLGKAQGNAFGVANDCLDAKVVGTIGNCIEPAIVITDRCEARVYKLQFDACYGSRDVDTTGLVSRGSKLMRATVEETRGKRRELLKPIAVRGKVGDGIPMMSSTDFDIEVDVERAGVTETHHLRGRAASAF